MKTPVIFSRESFFYLAAVFFLSMITGCATISSSYDPRAFADQTAEKAQLIKESVPTRIFTLTAYSRFKKQGQPLSIYIEGDGRAWLSKNHLSDDPTPIHSLVLELTALDPSENVAYLARPCQYSSDPHCDASYWSDKRFSEEVIASMDQAVDQLKEKAGAKEVHLIGYSGGAAVSVLIAVRRHDVASLRTIAGNLDPGAVNQTHHVSPLEGSLDPMDAADKLSRLPQCHFVGSDDEVVPSFIARAFQKKSGTNNCIQVIEFKGVNHSKGWKEHWRDVVKKPANCRNQ